MLQRHKVKKPRYYAKLIAHSKHSVKEKKLAVAILIPESRGNEKATSPVGAKGAWQVMPAWEKKLKIKGSLYDPAVCLDAAMRVWNIHLADAKGDVRVALNRYSGGTKGYVSKIEILLKELA
jgi:soluble lytic murein transglycosylase-like protein